MLTIVARVQPVCDQKQGALPAANEHVGICHLTCVGTGRSSNLIQGERDLLTTNMPRFPWMKMTLTTVGSTYDLSVFLPTSFIQES